MFPEFMTQYFLAHFKNQASSTLLIKIKTYILTSDLLLFIYPLGGVIAQPMA